MSPSIRPAFAFTLVCGLLATSLAHAETFFVRPLTSTAVSKDELSSINEIVRLSVNEISGAQVVDSEKQAGAILESKLLKLGSAYVFGMSKIRGGQVVFTQQARSKSIEDMDTVAARVSRAVVNEVKFENDTRVTDVTEDQVKRSSRRIEATRQWSFGLGPGGGMAVNSSKVGTFWHIGYQWGLDANYALSLAYEGVSVKDTSASLGNLQIGLDYVFNDHNASPYISGGFGYGSASAETTNKGFFNSSDDNASGFTLGVGAGYKFFRSSTVNLGVGARYWVVLDTTSQGTPSAWATALTVYF